MSEENNNEKINTNKHIDKKSMKINEVEKRKDKFIVIFAICLFLFLFTTTLSIISYWYNIMKQENLELKNKYELLINDYSELKENENLYKNEIKNKQDKLDMIRSIINNEIE